MKTNTIFLNEYYTKMMWLNCKKKYFQKYNTFQDNACLMLK